MNADHHGVKIDYEPSAITIHVREHRITMTSKRKIKNFITKVLKWGTNVNVKDPFGKPCLILALECDSIDDAVVFDLINRGASCTEPDSFGNTPLHAAVRAGRSLKLVQEILNRGGDVTARNSLGETPIFSACQYHFGDNLETIRELLKRGASVTVRDDDGHSAIQMAVRCEKPLEVVEEFIKYGADINSTDQCGDTPLSELSSDHVREKFYLMDMTNWGAFVHNSFPVSDLVDCYDLDYNVVEIIKYALIEHPFEIYCVYCDNLRRNFTQVVDYCLEELHRMRNQYIYNGYSLYDFVTKKWDYGKVFLKQYDIGRNFNLVARLQHEFPLYYRVLLSRLETRKYYLRYFYDTPFSTEINKKYYHLCHCSLRIIGKYLSKDDMINVICAFTDDDAESLALLSYII